MRGEASVRGLAFPMKKGEEIFRLSARTQRVGLRELISALVGKGEGAGRP
jgi:hypothetical protein